MFLLTIINKNGIISLIIVNKSTMDKVLIKQSLDEWHELLLSARDKLVTRTSNLTLPSVDLALALTGLRRSGKTYTAFQISKQLPEEKVLYYNFEDPLFYTNSELENLDLLLSVAEEFRPNKIELLILDEIQIVNGWERWLRKLIDQKRYRIIVTGSSAKLLSSELASSLTGRALEHHIWPLSIQEVIEFKNIQPKSQNDFLSTLREILQWGSLPEVVKQPTNARLKTLKQYLSDIILKDVISRHQVRNKRALDQVLAYYLTNLSSLHSYSSLSKAFNLDTVTVAEYSRMLADAFLVNEVQRYHQNLKIQYRDPRKVYIGDPGFRTAGARSAEDDTGKLLENLVYIELRRREQESWYYKGKQEVDFVIVDRYKPVELIQVCASDMKDEKTWKREINGILEAAKALGLSKGLILSDRREENLKVEACSISIVPAYKWLLGS